MNPNISTYKFGVDVPRHVYNTCGGGDTLAYENHLGMMVEWELIKDQ